MYLGTAVLARFEKEGRPKEQEPFMHWAMQHALARIQEGFDGLFENLRVPGLTWLLRMVVAPWSRLNVIGADPDDALGGRIASAIQEKDGAREWLTKGIYVPEALDEPVGEMEHAFRLSREAYHVGQKIKDAVREGRLPKKRPAQLLDEALEAGVITDEEVETVRRAEAARERYIQVDDFTLEEYRESRMMPGTPTDRGALASDVVDPLERDPTDPTPVDGEDLEEPDPASRVPEARGDGAPGDGAPGDGATADGTSAGDPASMGRPAGDGAPREERREDDEAPDAGEPAGR
jgi:acyl-CoA dehydrogenase